MIYAFNVGSINFFPLRGSLLSRKMILVVSLIEESLVLRLLYPDFRRKFSMSTIEIVVPLTNDYTNLRAAMTLTSRHLSKIRPLTRRGLELDIVWSENRFRF